MSETVKISSKSACIIQDIVTLTGKNKAEVIESALETYRHFERMRLLNESYSMLRADKEAWKEELIERAELEGTHDNRSI